MKDKLSKLYDLVFGKELGVLPGNLAYSFFLSIIPILTIIVFVLTSFNLPMDSVNNFLSDTFPRSVVELLQPIFTSELTADSLMTIVLGLIVIINGCNAIILASNTIYNVENASLLRRIVKSIILAICIILLFAFMVIVPLLGKSILTVIGSITDIFTKHDKLVGILYIIIQVPVSLLVVYFLIKVVYTVAPDERIPSKYTTKGALFTSISWLAITGIYSYYINNIARYDIVYGNLANIVMLLLWFYILAYVFVIGLCLNKNKTDKGIEQTNTIILDEIRKRVQEEKKKK